MNSRKAGKIVRKYLKAHNLAWKAKATTVGFSDLARGDGVHVELSGGLNTPEWTGHIDALESIANKNGFAVKGDWYL